MRFKRVGILSSVLMARILALIASFSSVNCKGGAIVGGAAGGGQGNL